MTKVSRRELFRLLTGARRGKVVERRPRATHIKKIVFGYRSTLPATLVAGAQGLRHRIQRAGLNVVVAYRPLDNLPRDTDILLVAEGVLEAAQQKVPDDIEIISLEDFAESPVYEELMTRLLEGIESSSAKAEDDADMTGGSSVPKTVKYRGYYRID